jgi:plasmid stability protein
MAVRQFITRLDEALLVKLKQRAAAEGRSVNALIGEMLASQLAGESAKAAFRQRAGDRIVIPPQPARVPSWESLRRASKRAGRAVSQALSKERAEN